jgi:type II secretory pathway component PulF
VSQYAYRAVRLDGQSVSGILAASDPADATAALRAQGLFALELRAEFANGTTRPAKKRELAIVFRSLAALVGAGVPLERALAASAPLAGASLAPHLERWRRGLHEGASLSSALAAPPGVIPPVVLGVIRAGERGSQLDLALEQVATHLEQEAELRGRVRQALAYPILVAGAGLISVGVITVLVLPKFAGLLNDLGQQLPPTTRFLLGVSAVIQRDWLFLLIGTSALLSAVVAWSKTPLGLLWWSEHLLALPVVGPLRMALATARLARALGAMLQTGLPILPALDAAADAVGDPTVATRLRRARERVAGGEPLSSALEQESACAPAALPVLSVGEASGQLALMASRAGDLAASDAERRLTTLVGLLEPALIVGFGGMVAFVAAALLQAVYSLRPG